MAVDIVAEAEDGLQGLELAMHHRPDLVTVDLHLPKVDGIEIIKYLKKADANMAVVVISALDKGDREACFFRGADAVLDKPVRLEQLQHVMERLRRVAEWI